MGWGAKTKEEEEGGEEGRGEKREEEREIRPGRKCTISLKVINVGTFVQNSV